MGHVVPPIAAPDTGDPLVVALADDPAGTFERVVLTYQDRLYTFALRLCRDRRDAEEVTQDAFVRAYRALLTYDAARIRALALRPWLYRITLNLARNRVRGRVGATFPLPEEHRDEEHAAVPSTLQMRAEQGPEQIAERAELSARLVAALDTLPPRYRTVIVLRHVAGLSYPEVAAALTLPTGTVKAQVHRGLAFLRTAWLTHDTLTDDTDDTKEDGDD
jgi:RNA polymerase sigma-70 factor (ECF subfamily)